MLKDKTINFLLEESLKKKFILNTPKRIVSKLDKLISITPPKYKKTLIEIKSILIGKYPNEKSLKNSLKGLNKKSLSLTENTNKLNKILTTLIISLSVLVTGLGVPMVDVMSGGKLSAPIERLYNSSENYTKNVYLVEVDEKEWKEIEILLDKFEEELLKENGTDKAIESIRDDLKKKSVYLIDKSDDFDGSYNRDTNEITINKELVNDIDGKHFKKTAPLQKQNIKALRAKLGGTLYHEFSHKQQRKNLSNLQNAFTGYRYDTEVNQKERDNTIYSKKAEEVGAYHKQLSYLFKTEPSMGRFMIKKLLKGMPQVLKNMITVYPEDDSVVKEIMKISKDDKSFQLLKHNINLSDNGLEKLKKNIKG